MTTYLANWRLRRGLMAVVGVVTLMGAGCASAPVSTPLYDESAARDEIWAKELAIYAARSEGDLQVYLDNASDHYLGWPPGWDAPEGLDRLRAGVKLMRGDNSEKLVMNFADITFSGTAAVIYYDTHRTRLPTGEPVDQRFHIVHVWAFEDGTWKLLGALGRTAAAKNN